MKRFPERKVTLLFIMNIGTLLFVLIFFGFYSAFAKHDLSLTSQSQNQGMLSYQGTVMDNLGNPLSGSYEMTFRIYSSSADPTPLWEEMRVGQNAVPVENGFFNVMLGSLNPLPVSLANYESLFLGIQIAPDPNEMSPRSEIVGNFLTNSTSDSNLPVGTVISWWRPDGNTPLPSGEWMIADGSQVVDVSSPLYGSSVPDLRNKFVMGVGVEGISQTGGSNTINLSHSHQVNSHTHSVPSHSHSSGSLRANVALEHDRVYINNYASGFVSTSANYTSSTHSNAHITDNSASIAGSTATWSGTSGSSTPSTNAGLSSATDNRPAYVGLVYLVKIK